MIPGARLTQEQCDPHPEPAFHRRYRGIVGSLGYLVNMTRPDLAWSYSELSMPKTLERPTWMLLIMSYATFGVLTIRR